MRRRLVAGRRVGELEAAILQQLWQAGAAVTGRQLLERMDRPGLGYTTVMTVLGRLVGKGLAEKVPEGRTVYYRAAGDADELTAHAMAELLASAANPNAVLAHLVDDLDDPKLAAELAAILSKARGS